MFTHLPELGVGLGYRAIYHANLHWNRSQLGLLELTAEEFMGSPTAANEKVTLLAEAFPLLLHGIELSLGSEEPMDAAYLERFAELARLSRAPWVSEHLSFVRAGVVEIGHLTPLPTTWDAVKVVVRNIRALQSRLDIPVLLENITTMVDLPGELTEWQFMREVLECTDAGLLLDVTNLYTNAINRQRDPFAELAEIPMERVVELHLAGGHLADDYLIDSHSAPIAEPVWQLTETVMTKADVKAIIIERDANYPPFAELLAEVERAQKLWQSAKGSSHGTA